MLKQPSRGMGSRKEVFQKASTPSSTVANGLVLPQHTCPESKQCGNMSGLERVKGGGESTAQANRLILVLKPRP